MIPNYKSAMIRVVYQFWNMSFQGTYNDPVTPGNSYIRCNLSIHCYFHVIIDNNVANFESQS